MDFSSAAESILSDIDPKYTSADTPIVELVSMVTGKGHSAEDELTRLCESAKQLEQLEEEFIETHEDSCNQSMEAFSTIVGRFNILNDKVGILKSDILRFRSALGSYPQDLRQLFWRKKRNNCILQILRVAKQISDSGMLDSSISSKKYYQCAVILRSYQMLFDQWPMNHTKDGFQGELPSLYRELHNILSTETINKLVDQIEKSLVSSIIGFPDSQSTTEGIIQSFENYQLPGVDSNVFSGAAFVDAQKELQRTVKCTVMGTHEDAQLDAISVKQVPIHECIRVWKDGDELLTCPPVEWLDGLLLRVPEELPLGVQLSVTTQVKCKLFVAVRHHESSSAFGTGSWSVCPDIKIQLLGSKHCHQNDEYIVYSKTTNGPGVFKFPPVSPHFRSRVLMVVQPEQDPSRTFCVECLSAIHLLGTIPKEDAQPEARLLKMTTNLLGAEAVRSEIEQFIKIYSKAFGTWRKRVKQERRVSEEDETTSAILIYQRGNNQQQASHQKYPAVDQREISIKQQTVVLSFVVPLLRYLQVIMLNYNYVIKKVQSMSFPAITKEPKGFDISKQLMSPGSLEHASKFLKVQVEAAAEQKDPQTRKPMDVAMMAVGQLCNSNSQYYLPNLAGSRHAKGWFGIPPPRNAVFVKMFAKTPSKLTDLGIMLHESTDDNTASGQPRKAIIIKSINESTMSLHNCEIQSINGTQITTTEVDIAALLGDHPNNEVSISYLKQHTRPPLAALPSISKRLLETCTGVYQQSTLKASLKDAVSASKALEENIKQVIKKNAEDTERDKTRHLNLEGCWEAVHTSLHPILEVVCSSGVTPYKEDIKKQVESKLSLEKMLSTGPSKTLRLFEDAPSVSFSILKSSSSLTKSATEDSDAAVLIIKQYIIQTPFNVLPMYEKIQLFEGEVRKLLPAVDGQNLSLSLKDITTSKLLPLVQNHARDCFQDALTSPLELVFVNSDSDPPVMRVTLLTTRIIKWLYDIPDRLGFTSTSLWDTADELVRKHTKWAFSLLTKTLSGRKTDPKCWSSQKLLPLVDKMMTLAADASNSSLPEIWKTLSTTNTDDNSRIEYFEKDAPSRKLHYIKSSQDLGTLTTLVHSLEWFADQLSLICPKDVDKRGDPYTYTQCYTTLLPGYQEGDNENQIPEPPHELSTPSMRNQYRKSMVLSRGIFFILQIEITSRCSTMLDQRDLDFCSPYESSEPDDFVEIFNRDIRRVHITFTKYLPPNKHRDLMQGVPFLLSRYLIRNICNLRNKSFTFFGIKKLHRNLVALQQNLALLVANVEKMDESVLYVREYYQCFEMMEDENEEMNARLLEIGYSIEAVQALRTIIHLRKRRDK
eukprot:TRINITY_DN14614_c0_g1_i1.p1 TRINITY_DN14614_c0_g1~~TRINITY_DN14614_c0_g1_i1.p1  ORF type:complete len:1332 (+),score=249.45 TRINITY_DN14614_c0_g1_i1:824-4819(+)